MRVSFGGMSCVRVLRLNCSVVLLGAVRGLMVGGE